MKKKPFITVETENLAVPEVHIDKEDVEETYTSNGIFRRCEKIKKRCTVQRKIPIRIKS